MAQNNNELYKGIDDMVDQQKEVMQNYFHWLS